MDTIKTITANIPATRKVIKGKVWTTDAAVAVYEQDDTGRWSVVHPVLGRCPVLEAEVIEGCQRATNWHDIRATHFPMFGFHA